MKKYSDKLVVNELLQLCIRAGIREAVISPGSRNAPLIFSFSACEKIKCLTIVDERSAAFFALGMAQQLGRAVALICTSGTAVLNYAPAIAEAYYQRVPIVVITADRPPEWIDQADGQTIRQPNVYANYIEYSAQCANAPDNADLIKEALEIAFTRNAPVHINVPLEEPLYNRVDLFDATCLELKSYQHNASFSRQKTCQFFDFKSQDAKVLFLIGQQKPNTEFNALMGEFAQLAGAVVLTESTSNLYHEHFIACIDRILSSIPESELSDFAPDLLITFDGQVISKKIKQFIRQYKPCAHWHISQSDKPAPDTYRCLTDTVKMPPVDFLQNLKLAYTKHCRKIQNSKFREKWLVQNQIARQRHEHIIKNITWSDLKVFDILKRHIPQNTMLQVANSTPVRYAQLFEEYSAFRCFANRGTSGIDGCTSTAAGAAYASECSTLLLTGDLSFLYDSNALWNNYLRSDFKIIVINNGGGGIFRYIAGKMQETEMSQYFEATQRQVSIKWLTRSYGLCYDVCKNETALTEKLPLFFMQNDKPSVLEIKTPNVENAEILREYFKCLNEKRNL